MFSLYKVQSCHAAIFINSKLNILFPTTFNRFRVQLCNNLWKKMWFRSFIYWNLKSRDTSQLKCATSFMLCLCFIVFFQRTRPRSFGKTKGYQVRPIYEMNYSNTELDCLTRPRQQNLCMLPCNNKLYIFFRRNVIFYWRRRHLI